MIELFNSIVPVFIIIFLGFFLKRLGLLEEAFTVPANRLVFQIGVPALVFREVARADFSQSFNAPCILLSLAAVCLVYATSWLLSWRLGMNNGTRGTFLQGSHHGNISYIGLALVLYSLGDEGLQRAGIMAGFLIMLNNYLSLLSLNLYGTNNKKGSCLETSAKTLMNPVVAGSILGLLASLWAVNIPVFLDRSLKILGSMALPTALLIMGAGLSFREMAEDFPLAAGVSALKLLVLPGIGWILFAAFGIPPDFALPSLLLLAAPSAALTFIMAREMGGDSRLATSAVGLSTLLSAATYLLWLKSYG